MSKKKEKVDAKSPDLFISTADKVGKALQDYIKPIMAGILALLIIGVGVTSWRNYKEYQEIKSTEALFAIDKRRVDLQKSFSEKLAKEQEEKNKDKKVKDKKASAEEPAKKVDFAQMQSIIDDYKSFSEEHKGTVAGATARINAADIFYEYKKYAESAEVLESYLTHLDKGHFVHALMLMQVGASKMAQKQYAEAAEVYEKVKANEAVAFLHPEAILKQGVCYQMAKDFEKAKKSYLEVSEKFSESEAGREAKSYLNLLQFSSADNQG